MTSKKNLNLSLKRTHFNEILSGVKNEEYRAFTDYYVDRLTTINEDGSFAGFRKVEAVHFFSGRYNNAPEMIVEVKEIILDPDMSWEKRNETNSDFVIVLGNILEKKNC